jgi:hypothetical protein
LLIVTYDENGGFFDHVSPLQLDTLDPNGQYLPFKTTGIRVPGFIISPMVAKGKCFSRPLDHTSILKFLGEKFSSDGKYSPVVNDRPVVGSVKDVLDQFGQARSRTERWDPPNYQPVIEVKGPPDRFTNANVKAFEHALMQLREEAPEEAARKFLNLADYFRDPKGLFWRMVQTETAAKGFTIAPECQYLLGNFVQQGEARLLKDPERQHIAVANLNQFLNRMMNDAARSGSNIIHEDNFYTAEQSCPMWPFC